MSDFHLGSKVCRADKILDLLKRAEFDTLIINGDLFDTDTTTRLNQKHWEILSALSSIAEHHKVLLVGGNHGRELDLIPRKMGLEVNNEYEFTVGGRQFLCLHGDEFDTFARRLPRVTKMFAEIYYLIQKIGGERQGTSLFLKRMSKRILGIPRRQRRLALKRGLSEHVNVVICSHTHLPYVAKKNGVLFINSGSFCDDPSTYITIGKDGITKLEEI
jgi:UDP-2,3-diacylglucosamine pyrophosphatase LpxH